MNLRYFSLNEFKCPCCSQVIIKRELLNLLDEARDIAGIPFKINSGYRCETHNKKIGGKPTSSHLQGYAADISAPTSHHRYLIINALLKAGASRIGIAKNFIHVDCDISKPKDIVWLY